MRIQVVEEVAGTTLRVTWVSSGVTASPISSALYSGSGTVVSSVAAVDSANGFYYALHLLPNSEAWYVNEWMARIGVNTYVKRQLVRAHKLEVD